METLCGQAYGARMYRLLVLSLQSSLIMSAMVSVLISIVWLFTEPILLCLHQEPEVSHAATVFIRYQIPGLFAYSFLQCLLRYLQTQSIVIPLVVCSMVPFALHIALNYLLVNVVGLGLTGASLAISATFWVSCLMLLAYVMWSKEFDETWKGFSTDALNYVLPTIKLAMPSAIMVCLEYWAIELLVLLAGLLPNSTVSTSLIAICASTQAVSYMITYGFSAAVSTRVSNEGEPLHGERDDCGKVRGHHPAPDDLYCARLHAGRAVRGCAGLWMAAPGGDHQPGGVLLGWHAGGHSLGLQAQLVHSRN
uniref:Protein TRANSPARENT TESTA 12 n=1 Tax=Aegilops tauschii TaxID=37682 RepID=N1QZ50_AEGTA